jgi:site-specific DNA-methyltransferase (adenine-specific)
MYNKLYYGDNLKVIKEHIADESIDLIYLDPPFNSNRSYNVLFKDESGLASDAQISVFDDSWHWGNSAQETYEDILKNGSDNISKMINALYQFIDKNQMMAYLVMMTARLIELRRVLKQTGSLYLHCDPISSHYLKIILDTIFSPINFRNEISWKRSNPKSNTSNNFANCRDIILRYSKSEQTKFNKTYTDHNPEYIEKAYRYIDKNGKKYRLLPLLNPNDDRPHLTYEFLGIKRVWRWTKERMQKAYENGLVVQLKPGAVPQYIKYLDDSPGRTITNNWDDIEQASGNESLGYPTQKPITLLERIISASSDPGDIILDPFSGCGTCIAAAEKLNRKWIGIDITHLAIAMHKSRLKDMFGIEPKKDYLVIGEPEDINGAKQLAKDDRYQFQWWALSLIKARPIGGDNKIGKKGSDKGIDGFINFIDRSGLKRALVQVKSGNVNSALIRDLKGTINRESAEIGIFITLENYTKDMVTEAITAGSYHSDIWEKDYPKIQIYTIEELLNDKEIKIPPTPANATAFKKAVKEIKEGPSQERLL